MNKEEYKSAMDKIKASEEFKLKTKVVIASSNRRRNLFRIKVLIPVFAGLILIVCIGTGVLPFGWKGRDDFKIIGKLSPNASASYASILYIDGYAYSPSAWLNNTRYGTNQYAYEEIKGDKLGEVTLDLKGLKYKGNPPDFSSTHDVGSEIYSIKNVKKERAVLFIDNGTISIFYREGKLIKDDKTPINLTLLEVFNMITTSPNVSSLELRSEYDGSWMRTSQNQQLLSLINKELPELQLLRSYELDQNPYDNIQYRVPVNLIFPDGAALHMQFFPKAQSASVFSGFVKLSPELSTAIEEFYQQGEEYPSIADLLPYSEDDISYLHFINHISGVEIFCKEPKWSSSALFSTLQYYRVEEVQPDITDPIVMTSTLGKSKEDSVILDFYEAKNKSIIIKLNDRYYKPVKGPIVFQELDDYLNNYTSTGL